MSDPRSAICIEGAGVAAALAAIALKRALPGKTVHWPDGGTATAVNGAMAPFGAAGVALEALHQRIGLDHQIFVRRTRAVLLSSIAVTGFGGDGELPLIAAQPYIEGAPLIALWQRAQREQLPASSDFAGLCRRAGAARRSAWRFDRLAYLHLLTEMARAIGIIVGGAPIAPERAQLTVLTAQQDDADWVDWSEDFDQPRVQVTELERTDDPLTRDKVKWTGDGIAWHTPHGACLLKRARPNVAEAIVAGHHRQPRVGQILRLGEAAVSGCAPDGTAMDVLAEDVLTMLALGPGETGSLRLDAEYNRRAAIRYRYWAEWLALLWRQPGSVRPDDPPGLVTLLDDWDRRGWLGFRDGDSVPAGAWVEWLAVTRPLPARIDPAAMNICARTMGRLFQEG